MDPHLIFHQSEIQFEA